jgi:hypothetical protein
MKPASGKPGAVQTCINYGKYNILTERNKVVNIAGAIFYFSTSCKYLYV